MRKQVALDTLNNRRKAAEAAIPKQPCPDCGLALSVEMTVSILVQAAPSRVEAAITTARAVCRCGYAGKAIRLRRSQQAQIPDVLDVVERTVQVLSGTHTA